MLLSEYLLLDIWARLIVLSANQVMRGLLYFILVFKVFSVFKPSGYLA